MSDKTVTLIFDAKNMASGQIKQLKADIAGVGQQTGLSGAQMAALGVGVAAVAGVAVKAGEALVSYGTDAVGMAIEEQAANEKMRTALEANVGAFDGNTEAIGRRIDAGVKLAFSDDATRASFTTLVAATHDVNKAFEDQRTAMDLARLKGISLEDASTALVRVEGGQYRALKALGIVLRDGATATEALAAVQKVAAGQAAAYANTIEGRTEAIGERLDQLQQRVGGGAIPTVDRLTKGVVDMAGAFDDGTDSAMALQRGILEVNAAFGPLADAILPGVGTYAQNAARSFDEIDQAAAGAQARLDSSRAAWEQYKRAQNDARLGAQYTVGTLRTLKDVLHDDGMAALTGASRLLAFGDAIDAVAGKAADDAYSVDELRNKFALTTNTLQDDIDALAKLEAVKHPTRAQKEDIEQLRLKVIDGKRELVDLTARMLAAGKLDFKTTIAKMGALGVALYNADGTATDLLKHLRLISGQSGSAQTGVTGVEGKRASGGPVDVGKAYLVGESGPELFVPGMSGTVLPNAGGGSPAVAAAGGGGVTVNIAFQTVLPPSRSQVAELADVLDAELRQRFAQHSPYATRY